MTLVELPDGTPDRFLPPVSPAAEPFWEATRDRRLVLQWCRPCERAIHFPREACPTCLGQDLEFRPAASTGTVYAVTVVPKAPNPSMRGREPYAVALVDVPEGVRLFTNVLAPNPDAVAIGDQVEVAWEPLPDGRHLPVFVPHQS
ncbi:MAG: DNA-binding protein [Acidimicrobiales bacterium]|nr:DNA-binding protein [Acidimicrobiales bacterium]